MSQEIFNYTVKEPSFTLIKNGTKKIEGRLFKNSFKKIKANDVIIFRNNKNSIRTKVEKINNYDSFYNMLTNENISKVTPLAKNIEESLQIYNSIYNINDEENYGVIAIHLIII